MNASHGGELRTRNLVLTLALTVFVLGCILHARRGTYYYAVEGGFPHVLGSDDAYIAYRYGWNLVHSGNLSWNESGFRRTEGFSDPLWMYISSLWSIAGNKDLIYPGMVLTSILLTGALLAALAVLAARRTGSWTGLIGVAVLSAMPVLWLHATSGLESSAFGLALGLLGFDAITREQVSKRDLFLGAGLTTGIVVLRSDGFVYLLVLVLALVVARRVGWKMIVPGLVLGLLLLLTWREINFGQLSPNTQVAKLNGDLAARLVTGVVLYLQSMASGGILVLAAGLLGVMAMPRAGRLAAVLAIGGWSAYYVYIGGDLFLERHLITVISLCAGLSAYSFARLRQAGLGWLAAAIMLIGFFLPLYVADPRFLYWQTRPQDSWILIGKEMAPQRQGYGVVVTLGAGKIPFFAGGDFVDELGLNDPELARIQRPRFVPGHSAGDDVAARSIARAASGTYSYFGFNFELTPGNAANVLLWADNRATQASVQHGLTAAQLETLLKAGPFDYSLIFRGR